MVYLGRICGIGLTEEGKPILLYAVSGRSEASKERKARRYHDMVHIGPLKRSHDDPLRHYDAISVSLNGTGVATNGRHTEDVSEYYLNKPTIGIQQALMRWGHEPDEPIYTPRIAAALKAKPSSQRDFSLGIVSKDAGANTISLFPPDGVAYGISTYAGDTKNPREIVIPYATPILSLPASGNTVQRLADDLYDYIDRDFVVCTAAALWDGNEWKMAVRNLHK